MIGANVCGRGAKRLVQLNNQRRGTRRERLAHRVELLEYDRRRVRRMQRLIETAHLRRALAGTEPLAAALKSAGHLVFKFAFRSEAGCERLQQRHRFREGLLPVAQVECQLQPSLAGSRGCVVWQPKQASRLPGWPRQLGIRCYRGCKIGRVALFGAFEQPDLGGFCRFQDGRESIGCRPFPRCARLPQEVQPRAYLRSSRAQQLDEQFGTVRS